MKYCKKFIACLVILMIGSIYAQDYIINEIAIGGKFIVRETEQNELMVIEEGNVGFSGTMQLNILPQGAIDNTIVVWDAEDKLFKIINQDLNNYLINMFKDSEFSAIESNNDHWKLNIQGLPRLTILASSGNVGIGTASPGAKLDIEGQIKITGGEPGIGKVLTSDATGLATWQQFQSSNVETSTLWTESGYDVYRENGNVGIGTTTPTEKLTINGKVESTNGGFKFPDGTVQTTAASNEGGSVDGYSLDAADGSFVDVLYINNNGNVGIGTTAPEGVLDLNSNSGALIVPRMTTDQRDNLPTINGSIIYNITSNEFNFLQDETWKHF